ncbi:circularly permuted type 2 ATP-grasp protein [Marinobacter nanhaiticus D15-8W]|uniref:circularly permuted type 2 ATP-grasp protein n=1 Tax=Marinobacter nanhaiticus TaxID=1305740 RepID=UPI0002C969DE|nr:circularly permuted type 2 ATP-grasp protein [Marinobacter nanhaiticus]BES72154.1 circularly permuted type 2 ATP-grasp protein [Marinobacter nanhaiticus D15-8W]
MSDVIALDPYRPYPDCYDELVDAHGNARPQALAITRFIMQNSADELAARQAELDRTISSMGVSFTVYSDSQNIDRAWPLDVVPRTIAASDWERTSDGLKQRLQALNLFIDDLYNEQKVLKDGIVPKELVLNSKNFLAPCQGFQPAYGVWANICGTDLVRDGEGRFLVLEDNLRVPSGVSYMLENRTVMKRVFPELFAETTIGPVDEYPVRLWDMLASLSPRDDVTPRIVVLTPGIYNSAYFEHSFLAQQMGCLLVENHDLYVEDDKVFVKTLRGPEQVDVIYRRIDDTFIDPKVFRKDSALGVPGLIGAWRAGNVAIANAPGSGVADDKVIYAFVPSIIRYYLKQDPLIENVPTFLCMDEKERDHVLANLDKLVVKPANESGGYGILIGPRATEEERARCAAAIRENPRNFIAQPTLNLSTAPTLCEEGVLEPRHLDLRPFILQGEKLYCTNGGLSRVALRRGSLVVNSSQGGGSKDTWIINHGS